MFNFSQNQYPADPPYEERLSWEGRGEKLTQAYEMCLRDYEFHVLSSAFLIHRQAYSKTMDKVALSDTQ